MSFVILNPLKSSYRYKENSVPRLISHVSGWPEGQRHPSKSKAAPISPNLLAEPAGVEPAGTAGVKVFPPSVSGSDRHRSPGPRLASPSPLCAPHPAPASSAWFGFITPSHPHTRSPEQLLTCTQTVTGPGGNWAYLPPRPRPKGDSNDQLVAFPSD